MLRKLIIILAIVVIQFNGLFGQVVDTICPNNPVGNYNVIGFPNSTYNWQVEGGQILNNYGDTIEVIWNLSATNHSLQVVEISNKGCVGDTVGGQLVIASPPTALIFGPDSACINQKVELEASEASSYLWNSGETTKMVSFFIKKDTNVSVVINNGCASDSTSLNITALPNPVADFTISPESPKVNNNAFFEFTGLDAEIFKWLIDYDTLFENSSSFYYKFKDKGEYYVSLYVENKYQCFDTTAKEVVVRELFVNTITPNGDGVNDEWDLPDLKDYPNCKVIIYDKWNGEIFYSKGYNKAWDGTNKGKDVPAGSYYYVIDYGDGSEAEKGIITVIR